MIRTLPKHALAWALIVALALFGLAGCAADAPESAQEAGSIVVDIDGMDLEYTDRDKDASYDEATATRISLDGTTARVQGEGANADGGTITISAEGTYVVSGTLDEGQLVVDLPGENDKAQLVLDNASIHNPTGPALYVRQADKVFVTLAGGSQNRLSDGTGYQLDADSDEPYATLFSKDDLTINGGGALAVEASYRHGICSKDELVVTGGSITVAAPEDALRGRDAVKVLDGTFQLTAGEDAIKSNRDTDATRGFVCIDGGTFTIEAGDDAIHGETAVIMNGGDVTVGACVEGYEAQQVHVNGGSHSIVSSDDAINASAIDSSAAEGGAAEKGPANGPGSSASANAPNGSAEPQQPTREGAMPGANEDCLVSITGGRISLSAQGDALDSNGSISISGGTVLASGPGSGDDAALDYEFEATISGGTVLMAGPAGMAETFTGGSQPFALVQAQGQAGSTIVLTDRDGQEVAQLTAERAFQCINVSAPQLAEGSTCQLVVDGTPTEFTASTTPSEAGPGMGGPGGMRADGQQSPDDGSAPSGEEPKGTAPPDGEAPDGQEPPAKGDGPGGRSPGGGPFADHGSGG